MDRGGIVILEPDTEGHSQEWLQHLIEFVAKRDPLVPVWLVTPDSVCRALSKAMPESAIGRIRLVTLTRAEQRRCTDRRLWVSGFSRWLTMRRHLRRTQAQSGFFLSLDHLSLPLALGLGARGKSMSGILFRPSVHYHALGPYRPTVGEKLRDLRKDILYRLMLRNRALSTVLSLDPFFPSHAADRYAHGTKVVALPDPAHPAPHEGDIQHRPPDFPPPGRVSFLLFGHLTERKGVLVLLDALCLLAPHIAARVAVLLAGRVAADLRQPLEQRRTALSARHPDIWFNIEDRRLDAAELNTLIRRSDVVLAPYQRFVGSSGVLLWAARECRPVLAQDYGLVGRLTREHHLGQVADSSSPASLAAEITRMVEEGPDGFIDKPTARAYAASHTPQNFASIVLTSILTPLAA